jgi:hypothetical protein
VPIQGPVAPAVRARPALRSPADLVQLGLVAGKSRGMHGFLAAARLRRLLRSFSGNASRTPWSLFDLTKHPLCVSETLLGPPIAPHCRRAPTQSYDPLSDLFRSIPTSSNRWRTGNRRGVQFW